MFNLIISFPNYREMVENLSYREALSQQVFYLELYPDAQVTIEPAF